MRAAAEDKRREQSLSWQWLVLRVIGAGLLVATAAIHLDLYLTGYRTIPTIGWLFLLQVISAFGLGAIVLVSDNRLASAAGAGFALATLGGYLLSLRIGLFGFREVRTTAGIVAAVIEVVTFSALAAVVLHPRAQHQPAALPIQGNNFLDRLQAAIPAGRWAAAAPRSTTPCPSRACNYCAILCSIFAKRTDNKSGSFSPDHIRNPRWIHRGLLQYP